MRKKLVLPALAIAALGVLAQLAVLAQESDVIIKLTKGEKTAIAVPDFRASGAAQAFMAAFNQTLWNDLDTSGLFRMVSKSLYPLNVPQQPSDLRPPLAASGRRGQPVSQGPWLTDWSNPPTSANYLAMGYAAESAGSFALRGWLMNVGQADVTNATVFAKTYVGELNENGARKVAHEFAADILARFGGVSISQTRIYFVREIQRGTKEIWSMEADGSNQRSITGYKSISMTPAVSPDGTRVAFSSFARGNPAIFVHSLETGRRLPFYSPVSTLTATPDFTPDGKQIVFASSISGDPQIHIANADGTGLRRLTHSRAIDIEPKVNPKTGAEIVFVSGRGGLPQIYRMNMEGADVARLSAGEGEAVNPSWHPGGQFIAFAWTRGFAPGNYNVFVMDVATRQYTQLTHGAGRNENPTWAPDGRHIVFSSTRSGSPQIWTMLADGTQLRQLTTQGRNTQPVWGK
jgi:TolB protein